ncbi:MAG: thiamine pyrophosphate-binding protein, partial [Myxococcota bacterium]
MPTAETIATRLARQLAHRGVRHAFGMPGGSTVPLLAAFEAAGIDFCLVRHEGAAGFMADAAYQLTGAPGVCVSTLGPGATNLVTGAAGALMERSRMLAIAGQCDPAIEALYTHQILDQVALFRPVTRHAEALRAETAARQLDLIFRRLDHGPPGPIYLELAASVARTETSLPPWPVTPAPPVRPADAALDAAVIRLQQAQRPVLFVGCGDLRSETAAAVTALADALNAPVMTSYRAKGMIDEASPWSVGAAGLSPKVDAIQQALLRGADLLIAVGLDPVELRPNWLPGWPETLPVINIDPYGQPDLIAHSEVELRGDPNLILSAMLADVSSSAWTVEALDAHRAGIHALFEDGPDGPAAAIRAVQRGLDGAEAVVSLDVGAHRITASHVWQSRQPGRLLQSNGFSSMGSGLRQPGP